jgi:hypothetical protein
MKIDRRSFLLAAACLAMAKLVGPTFGQPRPSGSDEPPWHPFTRSLLDRARQASSVDGPANTVRIEGIIRETALTQGWTKPPVIKWLADPFEAIAYLSQLGLDELLQMGNAQLWRRAGPKTDLDEDRLNSHLVLGGMIGDTVRASDHDRLLMAPKLLSKARVMAENASAEAVFKVRAVAAQIGWLETCIPVVAAQAVTDIELLLSSGVSEESLHHQLRVMSKSLWRRQDSFRCQDRRTIQTRHRSLAKPSISWLHRPSLQLCITLSLHFSSAAARNPQHKIKCNEQAQRPCRSR